MSKEKQRRFILLLSAYVNRDNCSKKCVLDYIRDNNWLIISERDKQLNPQIKEPIWRNEFAFVRKHLVLENYFCNDEINQWKITISGVGYLVYLFEHLKVSEHALLTEKAMADAEIIMQEVLLSAVSVVTNKKEKVNVIPTKAERETIVKQRIGQGTFRKKLIARSHVCQICGLSHESLLRASHIKPWATSNINEKLDIDNGLLLCALHDGLFDKGLISFSSTGRILISNLLTKKDCEILNLNSMLEINILDTQKQYMQYHREHVFQH